MSNPVMKQFQEEENNYEAGIINAEKVMTINGTIEKLGFMGLILVASAAFVWSRFALGYVDLANMLTIAGLVVGFILAFIIIFTRAKLLVPIYAACEGLVLGGFSAMMESMYPGIVSMAVLGTFAAFFAMLILYKMRVISCTNKFRSVIFIGTASIAGIYLIDIIGSFFGYSIPFIHSTTPMGLGISLVIIAFAALNLIIDFDFVERGAERMLHKDFEWYGAFGIMLTLVWLYVEILSFLSKLNRR